VRFGHWYGNLTFIKQRTNGIVRGLSFIPVGIGIRFPTGACEAIIQRNMVE